MEKRLLDEKEESPAKKLKMETKATEEESDNGKALISLDEKVKVKKAQNVQEKLAEMKNAYLEDLEDEMAEDVEEDELDGEDDVLIESETLSEEAKTMNEDEGGYGKINEKQASSIETECQVCFIFIPDLFLICCCPSDLQAGAPAWCFAVAHANVSPAEEAGGFSLFL